MKVVVVALLLLGVVLVALPNPVTAASPSPCNVTTSCRASFTRTIAINSWGVTIVTDKVTLTSTAPVSQLAIGVPLGITGNVRYYQANDTSGRNLVITSSTAAQSYTALTVVFPSSHTNYNFTLFTVFSGLLTYSSSLASYAFGINAFPVIDSTYNANVSTTFTYTGGWSSPKVSSPFNATLQSQAYTATNLGPYNMTIWKITFVSAGSQNLFTVSAARTITIRPSDSVEVTDNYNLTNLGPTVASIPFVVPKGVSSISESYVLGLEIDQPSTTPTPTSNPDGTSSVTFTPSFGSLPNGQSVKARISYVLSPSAYVTAGAVGSFTLNFALFNNVQFFSPTLLTKIITPAGFRLNSLTGQVAQSTDGQIVFQSSAVNPMSSLGFSMGYQLDPFWATLSPLGWAALAELALAGSVIAVSRGQGGAAVTGVPVQLINRFADLYDEKSSMSLESDKMEEDIARGALNRYDYKQRRRSLDRRMGEIDKSLAPVKEELASESGRYQDMVKRLERAEAELQVIRTTSADLKNQNRSGKISRDLYDSLSSDLIRRKERAHRTIDTIIITLREEIR